MKRKNVAVKSPLIVACRKNRCSAQYEVSDQTVMSVIQPHNSLLVRLVGETQVAFALAIVSAADIPQQFWRTMT